MLRRPAQLREFAMTAHIRSLHIYPIKSCAGIDLSAASIDRAGLAHDRRWMLVAADGQFMTQRQWPAMALIRATLREQTLRLEAPGMAALDVPLDGSQLAAETANVSVWSDTVPAQAESAAAAQWCSEFLKTACVLFKIDAQARRHSHVAWVDAWMARHSDLASGFDGRHAFGFADGFPLLIANQASLDELNRRLQAQGQPAVPMNRFRPNLVIEGEWEAYDEDHAALIQAGAVRMALVKPCTRCSVPDIDQLTGQRYSEPGRTLAAYRQQELGVVFGQNAIVDAPVGARLHVGDRVDIEFSF